MTKIVIKIKKQMNKFKSQVYVELEYEKLIDIINKFF